MLMTGLGSGRVRGGGVSLPDFTTPDFEDTFTDTNGTNLNAHTPDTGTGWTDLSGTAKITTNRASRDRNSCYYECDDDMATAGEFECEFVVEEVSNETANDRCGIWFGQAVGTDPTASACVAIWFADGDHIAIDDDFSSGNEQTGAAYLNEAITMSDGDVLTVKCASSLLTVWYNGTAILTEQDVSAAIGSDLGWGVIFQGQNNDVSTGTHMDGVKANLP